MSEHPIENLMGVTMQKIKEMVDVNTIVGDPITTPDGTTIIPVSKVSYGFASGGSDFPSKKDSTKNFGGGSGAGITVQPVGFLTVSGGSVRLMSVDNNSAADKIVDMVPEIVDKLKQALKKDKPKDKQKKEESDDIPEIEVKEPEV